VAALSSEDATDPVAFALHESTAEEIYTGQQSKSVIPDAIPADQVSPSVCSGSEQSQTAN
jgi:hypothetical protein